MQLNLKVPSCRFSLYCALFDSRFRTDVHEVDDKAKLRITIEGALGEDPKSISIFRDDLKTLIGVLESLEPYVSERETNLK